MLSHRHIAPALAARRAGARSARVSTDLGLTSVEARLGRDGPLLADGTLLRWGMLEVVSAAASRGPFGDPCFVVEGGSIERVQLYSEWTGRPCSLIATHGAPTVVLAGFPMHRVKGIDPYRDTLLKMRTLAPVRGPVLDTTTGLGYTAIEAARTADRVVTIELDPAVLAVARLNPWSRPLFADDTIERVVGDATEVVPTLADASFARIVHDPPSFSLAGELYSRAFYAHLRRVLRPGGRLFHYTGDPESGLGRRITTGVKRRLLDAGFERVVERPQAFGLVAYR